MTLPRPLPFPAPLHKSSQPGIIYLYMSKNDRTGFPVQHWKFVFIRAIHASSEKNTLE
jgi:hypothetical protein